MNRDFDFDERPRTRSDLAAHPVLISAIVSAARLRKPLHLLSFLFNARPADITALILEHSDDPDTRLFYAPKSQG